MLVKGMVTGTEDGYCIVLLQQDILASSLLNVNGVVWLQVIWCSVGAAGWMGT